MSRTQIAALRKMYESHAQDTAHGRKLDRVGLKQLMERLGHPDDELEIEHIIKEWGRQKHQTEAGFIEFDAFVSMLATSLKKEQLDERVEHDFLLLCGIS